MKTLLVNLFGAPCSGKSVKMMQLAVVGKIRKYFCEICAEVAKEYVVQKIPISREVQMELTREQCRRLKCFVGNCEVVVTDAPVLIGAFYSHYRGLPGLEEIDGIFNGYAGEVAERAARAVNLYMWRDHAYEEAGRIETEREDAAIAKRMWEFVQERCKREIVIEGRSTESPEAIWERVMAAAGW